MSARVASQWALPIRRGLHPGAGWSDRTAMGSITALCGQFGDAAGTEELPQPCPGVWAVAA